MEEMRMFDTWKPANLEVDKELGVLRGDVPDLNHLRPRAGLLELCYLEPVRLLPLPLAQLLLRRLLVIALLPLLLVLILQEVLNTSEGRKCPSKPFTSFAKRPSALLSHSWILQCSLSQWHGHGMRDATDLKIPKVSQLRHMTVTVQYQYIDF